MKRRLRLSYIENICAPPIANLERTTTLPTHQLAGHAANVDFWMAEIKHCLDVIDGYPQRFERMKKAQRIQAELDDINEKNIQRGFKEQQRKDLRLKVHQAAQRFLERCYNEQMIDFHALENHRIVIR